MGKICFVGAHPDDETFMLGGTLAKYANEGHQIKVISATKGEGGMWSDVESEGKELAEVREKEHATGLKKLGITDLEYLNFIDGTLANQNVIELTDKVSEILNEYKPEILITPDLNGVSGHIDHVVMAIVSTYVFQKVTTIKKLYYYVAEQTEPDLIKRDYWGRNPDEITTRVNVKKYIKLKIEACCCHETQKRDVERLMPYWEEKEEECFVLAGSRFKTEIPENDLWRGIN